MKYIKKTKWKLEKKLREIFSLYNLISFPLICSKEMLEGSIKSQLSDKKCPGTVWRGNGVEGEP